MRGGGAAVGCGVAMLPLLFRAARCERTLHTKRRTQCRSMGQSACKGAPTGRGLWGFSWGLGIKAIEEPETVPRVKTQDRNMNKNNLKHKHTLWFHRCETFKTKP